MHRKTSILNRDTEGKTVLTNIFEIWNVILSFPYFCCICIRAGRKLT